MSQPSSSIISADNAEIKYKKALKEISKLISANRALRESNDKATAHLKEKIDQLSLRYEDLEKQYDSMRKEKQSFTHYLDEVQKERKNLEREVGYLNDVLAEQTAELKKMSMHQDERAVASLIRTYEQKEASMNRARNQNEEMISKLKATVEKLENELQYEKASKQQTEDHYKRLSMEMSNYKEQNSSLLMQIERLLKDSSEKDAYCAQKEKQLRMLVNQLQKQINIFRTVQDESFKAGKSGQTEIYQQLLVEKNKQAIELSRLQNAYEEMLSREKQYFEMEERMKSARLQAERANEEVNMLKSKIVVLEAKEFLEEAGDDDYDQKFFEERLNLLVAQNDPLNSIKNHEDSSHFRILKSFIVDLQDKVYKASTQKKEVTKKYKSIKVKFIKNAQQLSKLEEQNKLMRGKLQGYERLTEKLQYELERALASNEQEITRMTITSNNLITKKVDEYKSTIQLLNSQLDMSQDKAARSEKNYKQQIETLRLELDTLKIRYKDETDKTGKDSELIELYKKKNSQLSNRMSSLEEQLSTCTQNMNKFEHLFKEQKGKNEGLLAQKQQLLAQTRQLSEQADKKSSTFTSNFKIKEDQYEFEIRKLRGDNQKMKDELEYNVKQVKSLQRDLEELRKGDQGEFTEIKRLSQRNSELESKIVELKRSIRGLEDQIETSKIKNKKFQEGYERTIKFEEENLSKNDKINDLTREKILLQSEIKNLQNHLNEEVKQNQQFKKQLSNLKMKNLQVTHQSKRQFESKFLQSKKTIQALNQEISDLITQLRDQKSKNSRTAHELANLKAEKNRLQDLIDANRKRDLQNEGEIGNIKLEISNAVMEIERLQGEVKNQQSISSGLNSEIEILQQKIFSQNQQLSTFKMKLQSAQDLKNDLVKDLNSLKFNFTSVESHANQAKNKINLPWPEQNFLSGLSDILSKVRRICRNYGITIESSTATVITGSPVLSLDAPANQTYTNALPKTPSQDRNIGGGGNDYLNFFKSYADGHDGQAQGQGSSFRSAGGQAQDNRNFGTSIGTTQSIGLGRTQYNYSSSSYAANQGFTSANQSWNKPSYNFSSTGRNNNNYSEFNFSALSKGLNE